MTKKTTAAKNVTVNVAKLVEENERLVKLTKEQSEVISMQKARIDELKNDMDELDKRVNSYALQGNHLAEIVEGKNREIKSYSALCDGLKRDNAVLRRRLGYAESELFKTKETLFNKIHEHEAITPDGQTALTSVLPALRFDINGEVL